jgi:hypothetical protein
MHGTSQAVRRRPSISQAALSISGITAGDKSYNASDGSHRQHGGRKLQRPVCRAT